MDGTDIVSIIFPDVLKATVQAQSVEQQEQPYFKMLSCSHLDSDPSDAVPYDMLQSTTL